MLADFEAWALVAVLFGLVGPLCKPPQTFVGFRLLRFDYLVLTVAPTLASLEFGCGLGLGLG